MTEQRKNQDVRSKNGNSCEIRRAAAVLLALGLGFGSVCAAAEDLTGLGTQNALPIQAEEVYGTAPEDTVEEAYGDMNDMPVLFADEEELIDEDTEIMPEAENEDIFGGAEEAAPEISVEAIQTSDGEAYGGYGIPGSEVGETGSEPAGDNSVGNGLPESGMPLSGECGAQPGTVYWSLDEDGVLTITGDGPMADWESAEQTPWYSRLVDLRKIVIAEGVTSVGAHAFCGAQTAGEVVLADSIERVGAFAFYQCGGFGSVTIG